MWLVALFFDFPHIHTCIDTCINRYTRRQPRAACIVFIPCDLTISIPRRPTQKLARRRAVPHFQNGVVSFLIISSNLFFFSAQHSFICTASVQQQWCWCFLIDSVHVLAGVANDAAAWVHRATIAIQTYDVHTGSQPCSVVPWGSPLLSLDSTYLMRSALSGEYWLIPLPCYI